MKKRLLSLIALAASCCMNVTAQVQQYTEFQQYTQDNEPEQEPSLLSQISAGIGTGFYSSFLQYSNLDRELFPSKSNLNSSVFSLFAEYQFGTQRQFGLRPQLSWLHRGGELNQIGKSTNPGYYLPASDPERLTDLYYRLDGSYCDFSIAFTYQFGNEQSKWRPYVGIGPVFGFATGGSVLLGSDHIGYSSTDVRFKASTANLSSAYMAVRPVVGCKYNASLMNIPFFVALEAGYDLGLTDTYGHGDKKGCGTMYKFFSSNEFATGTRKISGFGISLSVGVPLNAFAPKKTVRPEPAPVVEAPAAVVVEAPIEPECYSLEEVMEMLNNGVSIKGKKICAIDGVINFQTNQASLLKNSYSYLNKLAEVLRQIDGKVLVLGHTDNVGSAEYNMELSRRRAKTVYDYLIKRGVHTDRIAYQGYGLTFPIADNDTEEGRRQNRRVEFVIQ